MKLKFISFLIISLILLSVTAAAEDIRNIYVGDIIKLEIDAGYLTAGDITEKFYDFEIVEIIEESGKYLLSVRTFEPGEYNILIGNKEIIINVASTLDDIEREEVYIGGIQIMEPDFDFNLRIFLYIAAGIFLISGVCVFVKIVRTKKIKKLTPYRMFIKRTGALQVGNQNYLVELTRCLKEYIENLYNRRIIGKTSSEILSELESIPGFDIMIPLIGEWLKECDRLKFTGITPSDDKKREQYFRLVDIAGKINVLNEIKEEGAA